MFRPHPELGPDLRPDLRYGRRPAIACACCQPHGDWMICGKTKTYV